MYVHIEFQINETNYHIQSMFSYGYFIIRKYANAVKSANRDWPVEPTTWSRSSAFRWCANF